MCVKEQSREICLEAVMQNGNALIYVKNPTPSICLEAVRKVTFDLETMTKININNYCARLVEMKEYQNCQKIINLAKQIILEKTQ